MCQAAQEQQGDPEAGSGYELTAIAIVVIGGTSLMGGRGGIALTIIGTFTIGYLDKILSINSVPEAARLMLTGLSRGRRADAETPGLVEGLAGRATSIGQGGRPVRRR